MDLARSVNYYVDRLVFQYRDKPKARAMIAIMVKQMMADGVIGAVNDAFCVDTAVGKQLDTIGKYVGIPRNLGDPSALPFFGLWDSTVTDPGLQNVNGFQDSTDSSVNAEGLFFQSVQQGSRNTDLGDDAYRFMIKLKIASNHSDASLASIDALLVLFFGSGLQVKDNQDMSLSYFTTAALPVSTYVLTQYLPRPMGCSVSVSAFSAAVSPVSASGPGIAPATVTTSAPFIAVPSGGSAPYTYAWELVNDTGTLPATPLPFATAPTSDTTYIARYFAAGGTRTSAWRCRVTDTNGIFTYSNSVYAKLAAATP